MLNLLQKRRSIRRYTDKMLKKEDLTAILQAGLLAPTSCNKQSWEFILVEDKETLAAFGNCREPKQAFLPQAAAAIVVLGDTAKSDAWVEDASIALAFMQLQAEKLGIGSCWIQIRNRQSNQNMSANAYVSQLLAIPEPYEVLAILALGYPDEERPKYSLDELKYDKVHQEAFGKKMF